MQSYKHKKLKIVLYLIIFLTALSVILIFVWSNKVTEKKLLKTVLKKADIELKNINHSAIKDGREEWRLVAEKALFDSKTNKAELYKLSVIFFVKNNKKIFLSAKKGFLSYGSNNIEAYDNIVIKQDDMTFNTEKIIYLHDKKKLYTDTHVKITAKNLFLEAGSMNFNIENGKIMFKTAQFEADLLYEE
jgi:LPS export ABC transporter protein LptC